MKKFALMSVSAVAASPAVLELGSATFSASATEVALDSKLTTPVIAAASVVSSKVEIETAGGSEDALLLKSTGNLKINLDSGVHSFFRHSKNGVPEFEHGYNPNGQYYMNQNPSSGSSGAALIIEPDSTVKIKQLTTEKLNYQGSYADAGMARNAGDYIDRAAALGMCTGIIGRTCGYGSMKVVKSNGVSCNSACDAMDSCVGAVPNPCGAYTDYYCYGSVSVDSINEGDVSAGNSVVSSGWFGINYCGSTNGMGTYCCCKANWPNQKGC